MARQIFYREPQPVAIVAREPHGYIGECRIASMTGDFSGWRFYNTDFGGADLTGADLHRTQSWLCNFNSAILPAYIPSTHHSLVRALTVQRLPTLSPADRQIALSMITSYGQRDGGQTRADLLRSFTTIFPDIAGVMPVSEIRRITNVLYDGHNNIKARIRHAIAAAKQEPHVLTEPEPQSGFTTSAWGIVGNLAGRLYRWPAANLPAPPRPHDCYAFARQIEAMILRDVGARDLEIECYVQADDPLECAVMTGQPDPDWWRTFSWWGLE